MWTIYKTSGAIAALEYVRNDIPHVDAFERQEILRHTYTSLLLDIDPKNQDFTAAGTFFDEWMKGGRNGTEDYFQGIFALISGDMSKAKFPG